jgi:TolB protein
MVLMTLLGVPGYGFARIYIDINAPSMQKFKLAVPDFKNQGDRGERPELGAKLSAVLSNDLDLSGYFQPMDKGAFLDQGNSGLTRESIRFRDWTVIGADLLVKGGYACIGRSLEVEMRLFDVFRGRQIVGKRALGDISRYRYVMHRLANEIIRKLAGHDGIFLTKLAFVGNGSGHKEVYVSDYDGHNVRQITSDKSIALLPRWSPDGKKLLYNSYKDGGGPLLYMRDVVSGRLKRVSTRKGLNIGAAWAPGGKRLALTLSLKGNPDIFEIDASGKVIDRLTNHWSIDVSPTFSPDGSKIAFVSNRSGSPQIYVRDLKQGTEKRLTFEGSYNTSPSWSSLNHIVFVSSDRGHFDIFTMEADGGRLRRLTEDQRDNEDPCWSPDGRYIIFSSNRNGRYHLYLMTANGQNQRRITNMKGDQTAPSWIR